MMFWIWLGKSSIFGVWPELGGFPTSWL
ncbi:hypothetical protein HU200_065247 [Digitaria exilis]|uniref:Uncharacterized protein n=1 Tax=Digitaria exilis TaxID=1010633 RepID=A0A835DTT5_9POAL|nr:hypothetical protein HU200_065247 [Digitaria exilis]